VWAYELLIKINIWNKKKEKKKERKRKMVSFLKMRVKGKEATTLGYCSNLGISPVIIRFYSHVDRRLGLILEFGI
jgi:hypothetical protein